jgi:hypothetical protein
VCVDGPFAFAFGGGWVAIECSKGQRPEAIINLGVPVPAAMQFSLGGPAGRAPAFLLHSKGPVKKNRDPRGWVGQGPKKDQGQIFVCDIFLVVFFLLPSPRNALKRDKNKIEKKSVWDFLSIVL